MKLKIATKKIIGILFLFPGITPVLLILSFTIQQQIIRHRMKEKMEIELLQTITLADHDIHWIDKGKELKINGRMFDVENIEHKNGLTIITGLYDDDETLLVKNLEENSNKNSSGADPLLLVFFKCMHDFYFDPFITPYNYYGQQEYIYSSDSPKLLNQVRAIITPPPQDCMA